MRTPIPTHRTLLLCALFAAGTCGPSSTPAAAPRVVRTQPPDTTAIPAAKSPPDTSESDTTFTEILAEGAAPGDTITPPDSSAPAPLSPAAFRLTNREFDRHGFKDAGEAVTVAPGYYPRHRDLYAQPFYVVPNGGTPRDLTVRVNGRPFADPITGATNFAVTVPEEIQIAEYHPAAVAGIASSGPVLRLIQPYRYEKTPVTRVVYRQGWYGLGRADWRIAQQVSNEFAYHIGVNIGEFRGRYENTFANTSHLRIGARQTIPGVGHLAAQWMQARSRWGRPFDTGTSSFHRNDVDVSLFSGRPGDSVHRELGVWYVRSKTGYKYGDEDGNRLGARLEYGRRVAGRHRLAFRADIERIAARFVRRPAATDPHAGRVRAGLSAGDTYARGRFRAQASLRAEWSRVTMVPDTTEIDPDLLAGGDATVSWAVRDSTRLFATAAASWRHPALDELAGYWSVHTPDRWMDLVPVPDLTTYYRGNPQLDPVRSQFAGGGLLWSGDSTYSLRAQAGVRRWRDMILARRIDADNYTRANASSFSTFESTVYGWLPVYGPLSAAASCSWSEPMTANAPIPELTGQGSVRYLDFFYDGQLRIRATVSAYYWGPYDTGEFRQGGMWMYEGLFNAKIFHFEAYYGVRNAFSAGYDYVPGYPNMHRDEIWGVRWVLFK